MPAPLKKGEMDDWIVEVSCLVDFEDLDPDDCLPDGACAIDGMWKLSFVDRVDEDHVLDVFHHTVPISSLEDFEFVVRRWVEADSSADLRGDLGLKDLPRADGHIPVTVFTDHLPQRAGDDGMEPS